MLLLLFALPFGQALSPPRPYHPPPRISRAPTLGTPLLVNGDALVRATTGQNTLFFIGVGEMCNFCLT